MTAPKVPLLLLLLLSFSKEANVEAAVAGSVTRTAMRYSTSIHSLIVSIDFPSTPLKRVAFAKLNSELKQSNHKFIWGRKPCHRFFFFPSTAEKEAGMLLQTVPKQADSFDSCHESDTKQAEFGSSSINVWSNAHRGALLGARTFLFAYKARSAVTRTDRIDPSLPPFLQGSTSLCACLRMSVLINSSVLRRSRRRLVQGLFVKVHHPLFPRDTDLL